eukprot:SAG11_NODE_621_length_8169_cov_2.866914_7_plen_56_part_00
MAELGPAPRATCRFVLNGAKIRIMPSRQKKIEDESEIRGQSLRLGFYKKVIVELR